MLAHTSLHLCPPPSPNMHGRASLHINGSLSASGLSPRRRQVRGEATTPGGSPDFSPGEIGALRLVTCEGNQVRQAEAVGQDDELHVIQVGAGGEHAGVQVLQHCPHAALASVRERHLPGVEQSSEVWR